MDGWSIPILLEYVHEIYVKLQNKETLVLTRDGYGDSQQYLQMHEAENRAYWKILVSKIMERSDLSWLVCGKQLQDHKHVLQAKKQTLLIKDTIYEQLKDLAQREGFTINAILQYAWHKILSIYGNTSQTIVGTTVSGRNLPIDGIENLVGLYINTLPLMVEHGGLNVIDSIKVIQQSLHELNDRSNISLAKLQCQGERLFDSIFVYENYPHAKSATEARMQIRFKESIEKLNYPLAVLAFEANSVISFGVQYAGELFKAEIISDLLCTIKNLLEQIVTTTRDINYLTPQQYQQMIYDWNATEKEYPSDKTLQALFEEQVERTPNNIAVVYEDIHLTYKELNDKANQLAHYLSSLSKIKPDTLIALCLEEANRC